VPSVRAAAGGAVVTGDVTVTPATVVARGSTRTEAFVERRAVCRCVSDERWLCVDGSVYGPCEFGDDQCEYDGKCPCKCHRQEGPTDG
jgi:hypothetical protein